MTVSTEGATEKVSDKKNNPTPTAEALWTSNGKREHYYLASGYKYRDKVDDFDDRANRARWQNHVYLKAHQLANSNECRTILDIGCGSGFKLMKYFSGFDTVGIEKPQTASALRESYPDREWLDADYTTAPFVPADIYICSDVIEHIREPNVFLERISRSPFRFLVISTPARDVLHGDGRCAFLGPPRNLAHYFEWTMGEFHRLLSDHVEIIEHSYQYNGEYSQIAIAKQKG